MAVSVGGLFFVVESNSLFDSDAHILVHGISLDFLKLNLEAAIQSLCHFI
jgi:hypothetical protein